MAPDALTKNKKSLSGETKLKIAHTYAAAVLIHTALAGTPDLLTFAKARGACPF